MRHHDCLWFIFRHILPGKPANEPGLEASEPAETTFEPDWGTFEPGFCERTRGGRMTQAATQNCFRADSCGVEVSKWRSKARYGVTGEPPTCRTNRNAA